MPRAWVAAALALCACAPSSARPAPPPAESGAFVVLFGADTIAVERYTRTADRLEGVLVYRSPRTMTRRWSAELAADGSVRRLSVEHLLNVPEPPARAYVAVQEIGAEGVTRTFTDGRRNDTTRAALGGPSFPDLPFSLALREQSLLHALRPATGAARLRILPFFADSTVAAEVRARGDTVRMTSIDGEMVARRDARGRLLRWDGLASTEKIVGTRVAAVDLEALTAAFAARDRAGQGMGTLSPRDSVRLQVGGATLQVAYGRPALRGRTAVGGVLVPWNQVWRMGANLPTVLTTDRPLEVAGTRVPAGAHALYLLPSPAGWTLILNRRTNGSGRDYDPAHDLARVPVATAALPEAVERLTLRIDPRGDSGGVIRAAWERTEILIPFQIR